ncbi:MAG: LemA family protein [Proteobacteria bacterium]|nr:LemA family protein [Pseudomonadota bacterium]
MSKTQIAYCAIAALLVFWAVGAHNRLVRLRSALVQQFGPFSEQCAQRHALLQQQVDALLPVLPAATPRIDSLRAACLQVQAACQHARARPGAAGAITSLRLAEDILAEARARLPVQRVVGAELPELSRDLAQVDTTLVFARRQFNDAVQAYNDAARQFPTRLISALFGFRAAGAL